MCGRYTITTPAARIAEVFEAIEPIALTPRFNLAPTDPAPIVVALDGVRHLEMARWGLIPWFMRDQKGPPMINARVETAVTKPAYRQAFRERHCLVPADGFYEWRKDGKARWPYLIRRKDREPFAMAGLWDSYREPDGTRRPSFTILTTDPNGVIGKLHDRMPVILARERWADWLEPKPGEDPASWPPQLGAFPAEELEVVPVAQTVNSVRNDVPACLEPIGPPLG